MHTSNAGIYQSRIDLLAILPTQTHLSKLPRDEILHEYISILYECSHDLKTRRVLEVHGAGALVAVSR